MTDPRSLGHDAADAAPAADRDLSVVADGPGPGRAGRALVLIAIVALALNLRPAAVSVGPVLDEIRAGLEMSATQAGVLTSLPVVAFACFGALAPRLAETVGRHRLTALSLAAVAIGLLARSRVDGVGPFLALSLLALAGMATANVVLPSLVRLHFPDRVGAITALYSTALAIGLTSASVLTVPVAEAGSGWRSGLAVWALVALVALVPWVFLLRSDRRAAGAVVEQRIGLGEVARTSTGWLMAAFFGLQSLLAYAIFGWFPAIYRDAGFSSSEAGLLLGVVTGTSIPLSLVVPTLATRLRTITPVVWALGACYVVGFVGLTLAPRGGAVLWAVLVGSGTATFPLVLTLIGLRARSPEATTALSAFTQSVGYLAAAPGPFGVGFLHDVTDGWTVPLIALTVLVVPLVLCGQALSRPRFIEDQLPSRAGHEPRRDARSDPDVSR